MKIELLTEFNELETISKEWDLLAGSDSRDGFFRTATWVIPWLKYISTTAEPFVVTVRDSDNTLIGLAPMCLISFKDLGFKLKTLTFAGREVVSGDFLDFIALPAHSPIVIQAVLDFIWEKRDSWDMLQLGELITDGDIHSAAEAWGGENKLLLRQQELRICPYIELPSTFDDYLVTLSKSFRAHIRRRNRDILLKNNCSVQPCESATEIKDGLSTLTKLHVARWRKVNQPGNLTKLGFQEFLNEICTKLPTECKCKLYILRHNEETVGALLAFHFRNSALYYQAGWDPDSSISRFSPGVVLMAYAIEDAISQHLQYFEFLRGDETYKQKWTQKYRKTETLLFGKSTLARGYLNVVRARDLAKYVIKAKGWSKNA
jgi:hypothetical protein